MSTIAIAVDAERDAAKRALDDVEVSDLLRRSRYTRETADAIERSTAKDLGEIVWSALDGVGEDSKLYLLDEVIAAVRDMAGARSPLTSHTAAVCLLLAWDKAKDAAIRAVVDQLLREDA